MTTFTVLKGLKLISVFTMKKLYSPDSQTYNFSPLAFVNVIFVGAAVAKTTLSIPLSWY